MVRKITLALGYMLSITSIAQAAPVGNVPWSMVNKPNGVAGMSESGAYTGPLKDNVRTDGTDKGTDVSASVVNGSPLTNYISSGSGHFTTFLGGANQMALLATNVDKSLGTSRIGLYEHANGLAEILQQSDQTLAQQQITALQNTWAKTGASILTGGGTGFGEVESSVPDSGYLAFFGGKYPEEVAVDLPSSANGSYTAVTGDAKPGTVYTGYLSADVEAQLETSFSQIVSASGTKMIEPFFDARANLDDPVATSNYYANWRKLAIASGGFAMDTPPQWAMQHGTAFLQAEADLIKWARSQHLGVTLVVSPYNPTSGNCGYQANFLETTQAYVGFLIQQHALPTQYAVENYCQSGDDTIVNAGTGDDVIGSLNQVALWLASQPVDNAGSAQPSITGTVPQNQLHISSNANASLTGSRSYSVLPNINTSLVDAMNQMSTDYGHVSDMAYQNTFNVAIRGGQIGDSTVPTSLNIFIGTKGSFLTQAPLVFQGHGANGNQDIEGGTDQYIHLNNRYNSEQTNIGMVLGTDTSAPLMFRFNNGYGFREQVYLKDSALFQGSTLGNEELKVLSDGQLHVWNDYSALDYATGVAFGKTAGDPNIAVTNDRSTMQITSPRVIFSGLPELPKMTEAQILAATPHTGAMAVNTDSNLPVIALAGSDGIFHWYPIQLGTALQ